MTGIPGTTGNRPIECSVVLSDNSNLLYLVKNLQEVCVCKYRERRVCLVRIQVAWLCKLVLYGWYGLVPRFEMPVWGLSERWWSNGSNKRKGLLCSIKPEIDSQLWFNQPLTFVTTDSRCRRILCDEIVQVAAGTADPPFASVEYVWWHSWCGRIGNVQYVVEFFLIQPVINSTSSRKIIKN